MCHFKENFIRVQRCFSDKLGTLKGVQLNIPVNPNAKP